jgi:hypothetical protein
MLGELGAVIVLINKAYSKENDNLDAPKGIRTPAPGLKGLCPGPLDDGGAVQQYDSTRWAAQAQKWGVCW